MQNYFIVFFGAGIGGMVRYWGSNFVYKFLSPTFPFGTLFVNILGSFIIGIVLATLLALFVAYKLSKLLSGV